MRAPASFPGDIPLLRIYFCQFSAKGNWTALCVWMQPWLLFWANVAGPFQDYHCPFVSFISCRLMPMSQHCLTPAKESPSVSANSGGRRLLTTLAKQEYRIYKSLRTVSNRQLSLPFLSVLAALWDQMKHTDLSNMGTNSKMVPTSPSKHKSFAP